MSRKRKHARKVDGVLLLDKPAGMTSNAALQAVKHLFRARKAGHTGSLDPLATGLLPICLGEATKISSFLLEADKRYWARCRLGLRTETGDAEGKPIAERPVEAYSEARIEQVLDGFRGEIEQVPPMYSALKVQGRRLYELAREGVEVERPPRRVHVHELRLEAQRPDELELAISCSKGTYVRTLVEDSARTAGTVAHTRRLHRESIAGFEDCEMRSLGSVERLAASGRRPADWLLPADAALGHMGRASVTTVNKERFMAGQVVPTAEAAPGLVRVYGPDAEFLGIGEVGETGSVAPKRVFLVAPGEPREEPDGAVSASAGTAVDI